MVIKFEKGMKLVKEKIMKILQNATDEDKTIAVHFSVGEKEAAINSHMTCDPLDITIDDSCIILTPDHSEHTIDLKEFNTIECDDECIDDFADATIDLISDHWSVHFDILAA